MKILIAEDNDDSRLVLRKNLANAGHTVISAVNGSDALAKAREHQPDLIVSDILMPEMDGFRLCQEIKSDERLRRKPFVFYTATYVDPEDERLALSLGASRFVLKPVENEEFLRIIGEVVREAHQGELPVPETSRAQPAEIRKTHENRVGEKLDKKIRELAAARAKFLQVERSYQNLFSSMRDVVVVADLERTITDANQPALREIFGYELDEVKGEKTRILYAEAEGYRRLGAMIFSAANPQEALITEVDFRRKDGSVFPGELSAQKLKDAAGNFVGNIGIIRDITDRKRAETFLKQIIDSIGEGIAVIDREYRIVLANKIYGAGPEAAPPAVKGRFCYEVFRNLPRPCHESGVACPARQTFETGKPSSALQTDAHRGGHTVVREIMSFPMVDESGSVTAVIEVTKDVTEQKSLEAQLRQAQKMEAIGQLAGGVAHDFNNILAAIVGYASLAVMQMPDNDPLKAHLGQILTASQRATDLTRSLLVFSRKRPVNQARIDLNELVGKFENFLHRVLREDIELRIRCSGAALPVVADGGQIEQVLMNLATNARDAMPAGGRLTIGTEEVDIDEEFVAAHGFGTIGTHALITVSDTGAGMDEATRLRIFEPFFTTKEQGKGTGLGLAMVYGIVKQHGGFINVYSEPGQGTTFRIYLPTAAKTETAEDGNKVEPDPVRGGTETILFAEDDPVLRKLTSTVLTHFGYTVIESVDGDDAIEKFTANKDRIQLVILDGIMPKKSGREAYDAIRGISPAVRAMFMSGYSEEEFSARGAREKGLTYILKPVSPSDLARKVRDELDKEPGA